jgi:hypothetical protein
MGTYFRLAGSRVPKHTEMVAPFEESDGVFVLLHNRAKKLGNDCVLRQLLSYGMKKPTFLHIVMAWLHVAHASAAL